MKHIYIEFVLNPGDICILQIEKRSPIKTYNSSCSGEAKGKSKKSLYCHRNTKRFYQLKICCGGNRFFSHSVIKLPIQKCHFTDNKDERVVVK